MKVLGQVMPVTELVALRALFATMFLVPAIIKAGPGALHTERPGLHVLRSLFGLGGITCFVLALVHLDLATATTLSFTRVLFMIIAAALILGEVIRWRPQSSNRCWFCRRSCYRATRRFGVRSMGLDRAGRSILPSWCHPQPSSSSRAMILHCASLSEPI